MSESFTTQSITEALERLPKMIAAHAFLKAGTAFNGVIYDAMLAATPEQDGNESGGAYDSPGSLQEHLDSAVVLDSNGRGVHAGVGYGEQNWIAHLLDGGHQKVTHSGKVIGAVAPTFFLRNIGDGEAMTEATQAVIDVLETEISSLKP